jgi:hypothetical protein
MNRFEENIRRKMLDFEAEPPQDLWESIEKQLDQPIKASPFMAFRKLAAAAAILLMIASGSLFIPGLFTPAEGPLAMDPVSPQPLPGDQQAAAPLPAPAVQRPVAGASQIQSASVTVSNQPVTRASATTGSETRPPVPALLASLHASVRPLSSLPSPGTVHQAVFHPSADDSHRVHLLAQSTKVPSPYTLSAWFAPQQSYRWQNSSMTAPLESLEEQIMSFNAGIRVGYKLNPRWEFQTGLSFNRIGQRVNDIASFSHPSMAPLYSNDGMKIGAHPQSMSTSMGGIVFTDQSHYFADISSTRIITMKGSYDTGVVNLLNKSGTGLIQHFEYLEIPFSARYKFFEHVFSLHAKAGLTAAYLLSSNVYLQGKQQTSPVGKSVGISSLNVAASGGMVLSYPLTPRMNINLEPTASMFIRPIGQIRHFSKETYPYSWSVLMGVSYDL